jgi:putative restriction endonuclease
MNIESFFLDYKRGGNSYIKKADSKNKWCGFSKSVIDALRDKYGSAFNIVIWGRNPSDHFYCIPFSRLEHLFVDSLMTSGKLAEKGLLRWTATIDNKLFKMKANATHSLGIAEFYVDCTSELAARFKASDDVYDIDYTIEDALANVKVRVGQSAFRSSVLDNFGHKCCISGISEPNLLIASHIIPWSHDKSIRSDPANGLCLFVEMDRYFDLGYISIDDDLCVIISAKRSGLSASLRSRLEVLEGVRIASPVLTPINKAYLEYHRQIIFDRY